MRSCTKLIFAALFVLAASFSMAAERAPNLDIHVQRTPPGQPVPVVLYLDHRLTMDEIYPVALNLPMDQRRGYVVQTLKRRFNDMGGRVMERLEVARKEGQVSLLRPLWILNAVRVHAPAEVIEELDRNFREIVYITPDPYHDNTLDEVGWGVSEMQAPRAWAAFGADGSGVIVGHKDSGTDLDHPGYAGRFWVNPGEDLNGDGTIDGAERNNVDDDGNGYVDDFYGWNFDNDNNNVNDRHSGRHGTRTGSVITANFSPCDTVCVAPGAKLMELPGYLYQGATFESSQYAIEMGAHVISASLSFKQSDCNNSDFYDCPNYVAHRWVAEMELAAGLLHANSSGNAQLTNPIPLSFPAPANCPPPVMINQPQPGGVTSIVSVNAYSFGGNFINGGHGPAAWSEEDICVHPLMPFCGATDANSFPAEFEDYPYLGGLLPGLRKPDVIAPTEVRSLYYGGGCSSINGTSGATPHIGGALALIFSAFPGITPEDVYRLLVTTCQPGPAGLDSMYGFGKPRLFRACSTGVATLTRVQGVVTVEGIGIAGVRVQHDGRVPVYTNANGNYVLWLPGGTHTLHFKKYPYADVFREVVASGGTITENVPLVQAPPAQVTGIVTGNGQPLAGMPVEFPEIPISTVTDFSGTFTLDVVAGIYEVTLGALPWRAETLDITVSAGANEIQFPLDRSPRSVVTGPDAFGHFIYDIYDADTVSYDWIEINPDAGGLPGENLALGDTYTVVRDLPFPFRFFGQDYTAVTISPNGFIILGSTSSSAYHGYFIPNLQPPNNFLAPLFEDWDPASQGGNVFFYSALGVPYVIVEWHEMRNWQGAGPVTFQAILYDPTFWSGSNGEGVAKFQYHTLPHVFEYALVGLENSSATDGVQYCWQLQYDPHASPLTPEMALLVIADSTLDVGTETPVTLPQEFVLYPNYPNPFNPRTTFRWSAPRAARVRLALYDVLGRETAVVFDGISEAGIHERAFDAKGLATGIYFA
ncbi:S8 family serine peptidase, partial [bacterium]|nr:S8 family serine peptidase [bacterium]